VAVIADIGEFAKNPVAESRISLDFLYTSPDSYFPNNWTSCCEHSQHEVQYAPSNGASKILFHNALTFLQAPEQLPFRLIAILAKSCPQNNKMKLLEGGKVLLLSPLRMSFYVAGKTQTMIYYMY